MIITAIFVAAIPNVIASSSEKYPVENTTVINADLNNYNIPLTKEQFSQANLEQIKLLTEMYGKDVANKLVDERYKETSGGEVLPMHNLDQVINIGGDQVYLWNWINGQTNTNDHTGPVNVIFYYRNKGSMINQLIFNTGGDWEPASLGWNEYGLHGSSPSSLSWSESAVYTGTQLEDVLGGWYTNRYHLIMLDGDHDNNRNMDWSYGSCHHEHFDLIAHTYYIDTNGWDTGEEYVKNTIIDHLGPVQVNTIDMHNEWSGFNNANGYQFIMSH